MTLPLHWRASARDDPASIICFIAQENPRAASNLKALVEASVLPISEHPYLFKPGRLPGTREIVVHPNYIVIYRVAINCIEVVNVVHARQEYP
jgi:toxin ParE1/3/4